ncbi:aminotransferase class I/II-fold pyridoxal phosphate-dependent enzyme [Bradyrhizobium sp. 14AA]
MSQIAPYHTISISRLAHELAASGRRVVHMEFGQPSTGAPRAALAAARAVLENDPMGYWESPALRARLARHYEDSYGLQIEPERFILTCGASPALVLALATLFSPGERVAFARPGYVAYRNTLRALHMVPVEVPCGPATRYQLTAKALTELDPAPAGIILASPANPTGTILEARELSAIAQVCVARNIHIISDEIYHGLSYSAPARSMLEFAPSAVVISSFSKYFSMAGWRLGWLLAPKKHLHAARARVGNLFLSAPSLSQHAALAAFEAREELDGHLETYRANRDRLLDILPELGLSTTAPPDGAFYIYADVGHLTNDSLSFCKRLLQETGVAVAPGIDFDPVDGGRFVRFSFAISMESLEFALRQLRPWFAREAVRAGYVKTD